jgi:NDP-sugar pyrophosphorylase family protein
LKPIRFRAVVLAAGLGRRLRPLTDWMPKPLLPVAGKPVALHTLDALVEAGCEAAAINLHHLGDPIRRRLGDAYQGMPLTYSEEPELLGTLGALYPLRDFVAGAERVVVINGDSLCRWPIVRLLKHHSKSGAQATFLVSQRADPKSFAPVGVDRAGRLVSFRSAQQAQGVHPRVFAGAHVLSAELLQGLGPGPADLISELYSPLLVRGGHLHTSSTRRRWHDLGTPRRYLAAARDWARGMGPARCFRRSWLAPGAEVEKGASVSRSVVERDARVGRGAVIERSLILPGGRVGEGCHVRDSIVGFETELPTGTVVDRRVVTPERADMHPREVDSVVGGLVYSPMEIAGSG